MKNIFLGLRTVIYKVNDMADATRWYTTMFGAEPYFEDPSYVGFNISGYELGLIPGNGTEVAEAHNVLTYWGVEDIDKEYARLLKNGAAEFEKPHHVGGEIVVGAVRDPWGNIIGLIYNPGFKA